jgi:hypothetical protein
MPGAIAALASGRKWLQAANPATKKMATAMLDIATPRRLERNAAEGLDVLMRWPRWTC